jgi:hypothetical protein
MRMQFALLIYESPEAFATRNNDKSDSYAGAGSETVPAPKAGLIFPIFLCRNTRHPYRGGLAVTLRHQGGERCVHSVWQPWD